MKPGLFGLALLAACTAGGTQDAGKNAENVVEFVGTDYAFTMPATLRPGRTTFSFANHGKVRHELNISRLKPGVTVDSLLEARNAGQSVRDLIDGPVGVLFADANGRSAGALTIDARDGERYAVICILRDTPDAKRHHELGMYGVLTISGEARPAPLATAPDTIVATDYAFQYPRNLSPGRHTFVMRNAGRQRHEFVVQLLREGVSLDSVMKVGAAGGDVAPLMEGSFGLLHADAGHTTLGGMTIDMLPDRDYAIVCFFRDKPGDPEHVDLGMYGSIRTASARPGA